jgi:hypothetical protein
MASMLQLPTNCHVENFEKSVLFTDTLHKMALHGVLIVIVIQYTVYWTLKIDDDTVRVLRYAQRRAAKREIPERNSTT